jgi:FkbM family methyltransferase
MWRLATRALNRARVAWFPSEHDLELARWYREGGEPRRYEYDLGPESVVLDVGGYEGQWASNLYSKYNCRIFLFEPVRAFAAATARRFDRNDRIEVYPFGLGARSRTTEISLREDGSSIYATSGPRETIRIRDVAEIFDELKLERVDLLKLNIEGGEYELIPRLCESGLVTRISHVQVQFHRIDAGSESALNAMRTLLSRSHRPVYQYKFIWESWAIQ